MIAAGPSTRPAFDVAREMGRYSANPFITNVTPPSEARERLVAQQAQLAPKTVSERKQAGQPNAQDARQARLDANAEARLRQAIQLEQAKGAARTEGTLAVQELKGEQAMEQLSQQSQNAITLFEKGVEAKLELAKRKGEEVGSEEWEQAHQADLDAEIAKLVQQGDNAGAKLLLERDTKNQLEMYKEQLKRSRTTERGETGSAYAEGGKTVTTKTTGEVPAPPVETISDSEYDQAKKLLESVGDTLEPSTKFRIEQGVKQWEAKNKGQ